MMMYSKKIKMCIYRSVFLNNYPETQNIKLIMRNRNQFWLSILMVMVVTPITTIPYSVPAAIGIVDDSYSVSITTHYSNVPMLSLHNNSHKVGTFLDVYPLLRT